MAPNDKQNSLGESKMDNSCISFLADSGKLIVEGSSLSRDQKETAKLQIDCVADLIDCLQKASAVRSSMNIPQYTLSLDYHKANCKKMRVNKANFIPLSGRRADTVLLQNVWW